MPPTQQSQNETFQPISSAISSTDAQEAPSIYRTHRRATISQAQDPSTSASTSSHSHLISHPPFSGYSTVPPSQGFAFSSSASTNAPHGLASSSLPVHRPPHTAGLAQRHHIPPVQSHLHSAPMMQGGSNYPSSHYPSSSSMATALPTRPHGGRLSSPTIGGMSSSSEVPLNRGTLSAVAAPSKAVFLSLFEQFYDSIHNNTEQESLKTQLESLLQTAEMNISKEVENERYRRIDWEKRMDIRFEEFRRTLSGEMLLLERRIHTIERKQDKDFALRRDEGIVTSPSDSLRTSRKRSREEMDTTEDEVDEQATSERRGVMFSESGGTDKGKGKRRFTTPPELASLTKRVEVLEAHASSSASSSAAGSDTSPRFEQSSLLAATIPQTTSQAVVPQHVEEPTYTTTFRPISSLRGT